MLVYTSRVVIVVLSRIHIRPACFSYMTVVKRHQVKPSPHVYYMNLGLTSAASFVSTQLGYDSRSELVGSPFWLYSISCLRIRIANASVGAFRRIFVNPPHQLGQYSYHSGLVRSTGTGYSNAEERPSGHSLCCLHCIYDCTNHAHRIGGIGRRLYLNPHTRLGKLLLLNWYFFLILLFQIWV